MARLIGYSILCMLAPLGIVWIIHLSQDNMHIYHLVYSIGNDREKRIAISKKQQEKYPVIIISADKRVPLPGFNWLLDGLDPEKCPDSYALVFNNKKSGVNSKHDFSVTGYLNKEPLHTENAEFDNQIELFSHRSECGSKGKKEPVLVRIVKYEDHKWLQWMAFLWGVTQVFAFIIIHYFMTKKIHRLDSIKRFGPLAYTLASVNILLAFKLLFSYKSLLYAFNQITDKVVGQFEESFYIALFCLYFVPAIMIFWNAIVFYFLPQEGGCYSKELSNKKWVFFIPLFFFLSCYAQGGYFYCEFIKGRFPEPDKDMIIFMSLGLIFPFLSIILLLLKSERLKPMRGKLLGFLKNQAPGFNSKWSNLLCHQHLIMRNSLLNFLKQGGYSLKVLVFILFWILLFPLTFWIRQDVAERVLFTPMNIMIISFFLWFTFSGYQLEPPQKIVFFKWKRDLKTYKDIDYFHSIVCCFLLSLWTIYLFSILYFNKDVGRLLVYVPPLIFGVAICFVKIEISNNVSRWRWFLKGLVASACLVILIFLCVPDELTARVFPNPKILSRVLASTDSERLFKDFSKETWKQLDDLDKLKPYSDSLGAFKISYFQVPLNKALADRILSDYLPAVYLIGEFSRFGILMFCASVLIFGLTPVTAYLRKINPEDWDFGFFCFLLTGFVLFYSTVYLLGVNLFLFPLTGKNIFLMGLHSKSDILESVILLSFFIFTYSRCYLKQVSPEKKQP